ncbi:MAG: hypothetical protein LBC71_08800 [Oscillospiraceae bacterium]|jgi:D-alanyl-D-alanine carboxypeptidase (penicillin-binding protein 5/6)|nr:hypothetical protein [Oscillospiraceae bacterium]
MIKKLAIFLTLILVLQLFPWSSSEAFEPFGNIAARSAILADMETGLILFELDSQSRQPADGLTRIMTLYIASLLVENDEISDNELVIMTETAWEGLGAYNSEQNPPQIRPGETMTFIDLMYSAYSGRFPEACNMIALRIAGSISSFVMLMNEKVADLKLENTRFVNPHGLHHENQYTSAYDMFLLYNEATSSMLFNEISSSFRHTTEQIDDSPIRTITSSNDMLNQNSRYYYRSCLSGISSATYEGGYSLVASAREDDLSLISVILGSNAIMNDDNSTNMRNFTETHRLFMWGYTQYGWREIIKTTDLLERVPIKHGAGADFVNVRPNESLTLLLRKSVPSDAFIKDIRIFYNEDYNPLVAPIEAGVVLGEVIVSYQNVEYARIELVSNTSIDLNGIEFIRLQVFALLSTPLVRNIIIILILIVLAYVALVVRYNIVRAKRLRRIKLAKEDIANERHKNFRE